MPPLIDIHDYIGDNDDFGMHITPDDYKRLQARIATHAGYDARFVIMPASKKDNYHIPDLVSSHPSLFAGGYLQINPNREFERFSPYTEPKELEELIQTGNIIGMKLITVFTDTPADSPMLDDFASLAVQYGLPLFFHCSGTGQQYSHPDRFRALRKRHPSLKMVLMHYGGLNPDYIPPAVELAIGDPLIYLNTSGLSGESAHWDRSVFPPAKHASWDAGRFVRPFLDTIEKVQDRVFFGSDYPELSFTTHPIDFATAPIREKVLYENAARVLHLKMP